MSNLTDFKRIEHEPVVAHNRELRREIAALRVRVAALEAERDEAREDLLTHRQNAEYLRTACLAAEHRLANNACQDVTRPMQRLLRDAVATFDDGEQR